MKKGGSRGLVIMSLHITYAKKGHLDTRNFISLPWERVHPRSVALLPRFGPALTNPGCTTAITLA